MASSFFFVISGFILSLPFARQYLCQEGGSVCGNIMSGGHPHGTALCDSSGVPAGALLPGLAVAAIPFAFVPHPGLGGLCVEAHSFKFFYVNGFIFGAHPYPNIVLWALEVESNFIFGPFWRGYS